MAEVRVIWRGKRLNKRTVAMLMELERRVKFTLVFSQGSYNKGGVAASAGTHDGGGAVDVDVSHLTTSQRRLVVLNARQIGFAAWLRNPNQGKWPWHIHMIAIGDDDLSRGAVFQVSEYRRGHNGLANRGRDDGPSGYRTVTWDTYLRAKAAAGAVAKRPPAAPNLTISLAAMTYARTHDVLTNAGSRDRATVLAWAAHPKVAAITRAEVLPPKGRVWHVHFQAMTKKIQQKFGLVVDGWFGPKTAAVMRRYGYTIVA